MKKPARHDRPAKNNVTLSDEEIIPLSEYKFGFNQDIKQGLRLGKLIELYANDATVLCELIYPRMNVWNTVLKYFDCKEHIDEFMPFI